MYFLFFMNFSVFCAQKIKKNISGARKILKIFVQVDWIFLSIPTKFQLKTPSTFFFRGGVTPQTQGCLLLPLWKKLQMLFRGEVLACIKGSRARAAAASLGMHGNGVLSHAN
jgi:hypothetical protein